MSVLDVLQDAPWWIWMLHILLYPLYQIIGTAKHEYSHVLGAKAQGLDILSVNIIPKRINGNWYWGYTTFSGQPNSFTLLAPYLTDIVMIVSGYLIVNGHPPEWWAERVQLLFITVIILAILPLVDLIYNMVKWFVYNRGDFADVVGD